MVTLLPLNLHWLDGTLHDPDDVCAHGNVEFRIGGDTLMDPTSDSSSVTVSAAALFLLRTLSTPRPMDVRPWPSDQLFPCCGFNLYDLPGHEDVAVSCCPNGVEFAVLHQPDGAGVVVRSVDGRTWTGSWAAWRAAVLGFADRVSAFYTACPPKEVEGDVAAGFTKFMAEWERRRGAPLYGTLPATP